LDRGSDESCIDRCPNDRDDRLTADSHILRAEQISGLPADLNDFLAMETGHGDAQL
jgi:hypothetical protein